MLRRGPGAGNDSEGRVRPRGAVAVWEGPRTTVLGDRQPRNEPPDGLLSCGKSLPRSPWTGYQAARPGCARSIWEMSEIRGLEKQSRSHNLRFCQLDG
jgi:hypothetical protein